MMPRKERAWDLVTGVSAGVFTLAFIKGLEAIINARGKVGQRVALRGMSRQ